MAKQFKIDFLADDGYVAESLRELANYIEENEEMPKQFETCNCCAEIYEEDY